MKDSKNVIFLSISVIALIFPIGFLLNIISAKVAFPIMFIVLGCQQLYSGLILTPKEKKVAKNWSIALGIIFILFSIFIVVPKYYF